MGNEELAGLATETALLAKQLQAQIDAQAIVIKALIALHSEPTALRETLRAAMGEEDDLSRTQRQTDTSLFLGDFLLAVLSSKARHPGEAP